MKKITRLLLLSMLVCLTAVGNIFAQEVKDAPGKLNLQQGHVTYQVGNQAINFYDDGGKEAPYSKEPFDGAVTFIPKDPSQKISINLHYIDVYWSEFAAKMGKTSDILIYNGRDTVGTPSAEIKDEKSGIYVSQANDGSLTVRFRSTRNGNNAGWEALVKQIPADTPMSVNKIAIDNVYNKWSIPKLDILTKHYSIFKVNIITEGIKPISLNNLKIAATQSYFDKAYLYKGNSKEIVEQPIATLNVKGNKDFNFETNVPLQTGNNYFYVVVDTDETVKDQSVKFSLSDLNVGTLTLEDATKKGLVKTTEEGQVFQTDPKLKFKLGHLTVPLDKEGYSILSEQKSAYSTSYNSAAGDRIITFVSQEEGMVVSCKFDEFNIGFNPYEKKNPSLTFYNGTKAEGEPIVAINNESEAQSYVGKDIRSNGKALTVKFTTVGELTKKIAFRGTVN
ncbi:MAG: hypothetical protein Q4A76_01860, partial [Porphyromonadaceae bacterium]|nr:hypothetical protein [Porphyromonadaceae bacterium]